MVHELLSNGFRQSDNLRWENLVRRDSIKGIRQTPGDGIVTFFSEARLGKDSKGRIAARDEASAGSEWQKYITQIPGFRLAARVDPTKGSATCSMRDTEIVSLPYYVGMANLLRSIPQTMLSTFRAVRESDLVIARLPGAVGFGAVLQAKLLSRPLVVEVVGDPAEVLSKSSSVVLRRLAGFTGFVMRWSVAQAGTARYVTQDYLQAHYPSRDRSRAFAISGSRLQTADFFEVEPSEHPLSVLRFGCVGSQERDYKGHDLAIRAIAALRDMNIVATLTLVGSGSQQQALRALVASYGLGEMVHFIDNINDRSELNAFYDRIHVLLHPSRTEGLPRVVIEAMARSKPVIASAVGGIPELIDSNWLFPNGNLAELIGLIVKFHGLPQDEVRRIAAANYATATQYSDELLNQKFAQFCEAALNMLRRQVV